jgi:hypothetical protein
VIKKAVVAAVVEKEDSAQIDEVAVEDSMTVAAVGNAEAMSDWEAFGTEAAAAVAVLNEAHWESENESRRAETRHATGRTVDAGKRSLYEYSAAPQHYCCSWKPA